MVAPASNLLGDLMKSLILFIGLPELKKISRLTTCINAPLPLQSLELAHRVGSCDAALIERGAIEENSGGYRVRQCGDRSRLRRQ